jgi:hypothetical protein
MRSRFLFPPIITNLKKLFFLTPFVNKKTVIILTGLALCREMPLMLSTQFTIRASLFFSLGWFFTLCALVLSYAITDRISLFDHWLVADGPVTLTIADIHCPNSLNGNPVMFTLITRFPFG